jgi:ribonuclease P/MRP protein subunit RPP1
LIAVRTRNDKIFHSLCVEGYNVDIITFDLSEKMPYFLKRGPITEAIKKGMVFEITYNEMVSGIIDS